MTLKTFFLGRAAVFIVLLIIGFAFFAYKSYFPTTSPIEVGIEENVESGINPVFVWKYEEDDSLNLDGKPQTNVLLEATYSNGTVHNKLIATTAGGCNDLVESNEDRLPGSAVALCYYAGLGYYFKVTQGEQSYLVWRKMSEEASPDYNPPTREYEVIAEVPLSR